MTLRRYTEVVQAMTIRRFVEGHRLAEARQLDEERRGGADSQGAIASALALVALFGRLHGWPPPEDVEDSREDLQAYERWARLRRALSHP